MNNFYIKAGYRVHEQPAYFIDDVSTEDAAIWQPEIYAFAGYLARILKCTHLIDIGCGRAAKLVQFHPEFELIGIDFDSNIQYCKQNYPFGTWLNWNLEQQDLLPLAPEIVDRAVIICADVIEHLIDPTGLLQNLQHLLASAAAALISTPDRDLIHEQSHNGPPENPHHVREWNRQEFEALLEAHDFQLMYLGLTISNNMLYTPHTMLGVLGNMTSPDETLRDAFPTFKRHNHFYIEETHRLRSELAEKDQQIDDLQAQLTTNKSHITWLEERVEHQDQTTYSLRVTVAEKEGALASVNAQLADRDERLRLLQTHLDEAKQEYLQLQQHHNQQLNDINLQKDQLSRTITQYETQLSELQTNLSKSDSQCAELSTTIEALRQQLSDYENQNAQLREQYSAREQGDEQQYQEQNQHIAQLNAQLEEKDTRNAELHAEIEVTAFKYEALAAKITMFESAIEDLEAKTQTQQETISILEFAQEQMTLQLNEKRSIMESLQLQLAMKTEMLQLLHARIAEFDAEITESD